MRTLKWIIAHFSLTGGTKKVTNAIAAGFFGTFICLERKRVDFR